jgi:hypothetical protein
VITVLGWLGVLLWVYSKGGNLAHG